MGRLFGDILTAALLCESASVENVTRAMDNHAKVIINYHSEGKDEHSGARVIEPVAYGLTKAGNPVIRAFQPYGDTTTSTPNWKFFRLDRISYWEETKSKFDRIPDFDMGELNKDGDRSMSVVIKTWNSTLSNDAAGGANNGPKTREKVAAARVGKGDTSVDIAKANAETLRNGGIYADLDNNAKAGNTFSIYTGGDNSTGPKASAYDTEPSRVEGSVENGDIGRDELERMRQQVYAADNMQSGHQYTDDEWAQIERDMDAMNRDPRYQRAKDRRWDRSTDTMFKNRKGSANRELYNMDQEMRRDGDEDYDDWFGND